MRIHVRLYDVSVITQFKCLFALIASGRPNHKSDYKHTLINLQEKAHAGNITQSLHPTLMQMTHIHIQLQCTHTAPIIHL